MAESSITRMEALSDGVFSVAMTLLLMDLRPKNAKIEMLSEAWRGQVTLNSILFVASFAFAGIYWVAHKNQCRYVTYANRLATWFNLLFLATVAFLPFSVSVLGEAVHSSESTGRAVALCWGNIVLTGVTLSLFFGYVSWRGWLDHDGMEHWLETSLKNLSVPFLCAATWLVFKGFPDMDARTLTLLMTFPPSAYLAATLGRAWWVERRRRGRQSPPGDQVIEAPTVFRVTILSLGRPEVAGTYEVSARNLQSRV